MYEELVKALRCQFYGDQECADNCRYCGDGCMPATCAMDAAAAIEELKAERDYYKAIADLWQESAESKERLLGMYRAHNMYSAKETDGRIILNQCANMNCSEKLNSPGNPDS